MPHNVLLSAMHEQGKHPGMLDAVSRVGPASIELGRAAAGVCRRDALTPQWSQGEHPHSTRQLSHDMRLPWRALLGACAKLRLPRDLPTPCGASQRANHAHHDSVLPPARSSPGPAWSLGATLVGRDAVAMSSHIRQRSTRLPHAICPHLFLLATTCAAHHSPLTQYNRAPCTMPGLLDLRCQW